MEQNPQKIRLQTYTFLAIVLTMLVVVVLMFRPLLNTLLLSAILAIIFRPLYKTLLKKFKSEAVSASLTVFIVLFVLFAFFWIFGQLLYGEIHSLYDGFKSGQFVFNRTDLIEKLPNIAREPVTTLTSDLNSLLTKAATGAFQSFSSLISNLAEFFFNLFLVFFAFFYLLKDGGSLKKIILAVSPISNNQENILFEKVILSVNGVIKGTFFVAVIQSLVALVGFLIFGIPNPLLWALCTFLAAFVPNIGTTLVTAPAVIYLLLTGHTGSAVGLLVWGSLAVGLIDNILSPKLVGHSAQLHPLLVLLSVVGGLALFGFLGILLGPIIMAVFSALVSMYITNFKEYLE